MNITPASIAVCNQKGGVGKSTFTVLLASYLHHTLGQDVLVVDYGYWRAVRRVASGAQKAAFSDGSDQQNAGDGNTQGSPLGRFAWPCGFSAPAFNSLPAERDYRDISDFFVLKGETIYAVLTWFRIVFPNSPLFLSIQP
nr:ParA family protein [Alistipes onderdonkii]